MFAGKPETVYRQIMDCYRKLGAFGHLILPGVPTHQEAEKSIRLFATKVLVRLNDVPHTVAA